MMQPPTWRYKVKPSRGGIEINFRKALPEKPYFHKAAVSVRHGKVPDSRTSGNLRPDGR